jgi:predicted RNA binding protein YcfA (HicA-like mRNA interferase family)
MNGGEFLRKLRRLGRSRGIEVEIVEFHGKGSHARVYFGGRFTAIKNRKKELPKGLLRAMCRQLGIDPKDLEG